MLRKSLLTLAIATSLSATSIIADASVLTKRGTIATTGAEIVAYHHDGAGKVHLYVSDADENKLHIIDAANPDAPTVVKSIDLSSYGAGINSVAVYKNNNAPLQETVAVAMEATVKTDPGSVVIFNLDGTLRHTVKVGAQPDMLTFTPGGYLLVANEGEPSATVDPQGSISILVPTTPPVFPAPPPSYEVLATADFTAFDGKEDMLRAKGVRIFPGKKVSEDMEPEYIAVSKDGTTARVSLQEANALAVLDLSTNTITDIQPLGVKDHALTGNGLDPSDKDGAIQIANWPVYGMYMPDTITSFELNGQTYFATANEGDARDEDERVGKLVKDVNGTIVSLLDPVKFPNAATLQEKANLGRLGVSTIDGDEDGDGDYDKLYSYGTRSFSIWDKDGNQVSDSGDMIEQALKSAIDAGTLHPEAFNANNDENQSLESRSDNKGPEPEAIAVGTTTDGTTYAFVGLERVGGIITFDISEPANPKYVDYINPRDFSVVADENAIAANPTIAGDLAPESIVFVPASDSVNGEAMLVVANEVSKTTTLYTINPYLDGVFSNGFEAFITS